MARNTVDACMFCGLNPCRCGKPAKAAPRKPATKTSLVSPVTGMTGGTPSEVGPETVAPPPVATVPSTPSRGRPNLASVTRVPNEDSEALARAITLFAERNMLHWTSLKEHKELIRLPDLTIRRMIWRQENAEAVQRGAAND